MLLIDASDAASGLPPLDQVDPARVLTCFAWDASQEGLLAFDDVTVDGERVGTWDDMPAVIYLSVRGWATLPGEQTATWQQVHIAIPRELLPVLAGSLTAHALGGGS